MGVRRTIRTPEHVVSQSNSRVPCRHVASYERQRRSLHSPAFGLAHRFLCKAEAKAILIDGRSGGAMDILIIDTSYSQWLL